LVDVFNIAGGSDDPEARHGKILTAQLLTNGRRTGRSHTLALSDYS
jgi:hypothetical protein